MFCDNKYKEVEGYIFAEFFGHPGVEIRKEINFEEISLAAWLTYYVKHSQANKVMILKSFSAQVLWLMKLNTKTL